MPVSACFHSSKVVIDDNFSPCNNIVGLLWCLQSSERLPPGWVVSTGLLLCLLFIFYLYFYFFLSQLIYFFQALSIIDHIRSYCPTKTGTASTSNPLSPQEQQEGKKGTERGGGHSAGHAAEPFLGAEVDRLCPNKKISSLGLVQGAKSLE
jgi:hypothetical protein